MVRLILIYVSIYTHWYIYLFPCGYLFGRLVLHLKCNIWMDLWLFDCGRSLSLSISHPLVFVSSIFCFSIHPFNAVLFCFPFKFFFVAIFSFFIAVHFTGHGLFSSKFAVCIRVVRDHVFVVFVAACYFLHHLTLQKLSFQTNFFFDFSTWFFFLVLFWFFFCGSNIRYWFCSSTSQFWVCIQ